MCIGYSIPQKNIYTHRHKSTQPELQTQIQTLIVNNRQALNNFDDNCNDDDDDDYHDDDNDDHNVTMVIRAMTIKKQSNKIYMWYIFICACKWTLCQW